MSETLTHSHGTMMILAWMGFGSSGVLFARYGRVLRFGHQRQCLGKSIWFQIHRFLLSVCSLLTLLAFLLIIISRQGRWINIQMDGQRISAHTIMGSIVVCCVIVQIWLALYRCHPNSRFRFVFDWLHRSIGSFALIFSTCNILLIGFVSSTNNTILITIVSIWAIFTLVVVIVFEMIQYSYREASKRLALNNRISVNAIQDIEILPNPPVENRRLNSIRVILLLCHSFVSVVLCISLICLIWKEN